jgi:hypothetical protein
MSEDELITQRMRQKFESVRPSIHQAYALGADDERIRIVEKIKQLREPHRKGSSGRANFDLLLNLIEAE